MNKRPAAAGEVLEIKLEGETVNLEVVSCFEKELELVREQELKVVEVQATLRRLLNHLHLHYL